MTTIDNSQDVIDSRDVIARIEELETERQDLVDALEEAQEADAANEEGDVDTHDAVIDAQDALTEWDASEEAEELRTLKALAEKGEDSPDWEYGETLIRESYFEDYARELAKDIGAIPEDLSWPCYHIDWEAAAEALKQDYFELDFDGVTYFIRA